MTTAPASVSLPLAPGRWAVDSNHSSVGFAIRHLGVSKVRGRFTRFDAEVVIGETLDTTTVSATVDVASIDTANADRDAHVLSPEIIDVAKRPTMVFRSTRVAGAGSEYQVDGDLTIGEITRPIVLAVELGGIETFPGGPRHAGFEATTEIRRKDFGIDLALPPGVSVVALGDVVKVDIDPSCWNPPADRTVRLPSRGPDEATRMLDPFRFVVVASACIAMAGVAEATTARDRRLRPRRLSRWSPPHRRRRRQSRRRSEPADVRHERAFGTLPGGPVARACRVRIRHRRAPLGDVLNRPGPT